MTEQFIVFTTILVWFWILAFALKVVVCWGSEEDEDA